MLTYLLLTIALYLRFPADCPRGCIEYQGWSYELTADDAVWFARAIDCEVGTAIYTAEASATAWALVQRFARVHERHSSFSGFLQDYCQCINSSFGSGGSRSAIIWRRDRVDEQRSVPWWRLPVSVLEFVGEFTRCKVPNRSPGYTHFLWVDSADHACESCVNALYFGADGSGRNVYFQERGTTRWRTGTVRLRCSR